MKKGYDSRCSDLAAVFLSDEKLDEPLRAKVTADLAQQIQDLIESFLEADFVDYKEGRVP